YWLAGFCAIVSTHDDLTAHSLSQAEHSGYNALHCRVAVPSAYNHSRSYHALDARKLSQLFLGAPAPLSRIAAAKSRRSSRSFDRPFIHLACPIHIAALLECEAIVEESFRI